MLSEDVVCVYDYDSSFVSNIDGCEQFDEIKDLENYTDEEKNAIYKDIYEDVENKILFNKSELEDLKNKALIINEHLINLFSKINIELIDFKIEFGKTVNDNKNKLILADEISPDNCRLWDKNTKKNFDKDIFRNNTGDLIEGYQEIVKRFEIKIES